MARRLPALLCAAAIAIVGCGGEAATQPQPPASAHARSRVPTEDARIIQEWSELLRRGEVDAATDLFALPATIANGTAPLTLGSRPQIAEFNGSLPCGAKLVATTARGRYTVATFRLTERPGGDCGTGVGQEAATAFRIAKGRIVEWLRVAVPPRAPAPKPSPPDTDRGPGPSDTV